MELVQVNGTSKKTGNPFTGYAVQIGKYRTPLFFPSEIELDYIMNHIGQGKDKR